MPSPSPSDAQWRVLQQIQDGDVWFNNGEWWARGGTKVTAKVRRLWQIGYLKIPAPLTAACMPTLTAEGVEALQEHGQVASDN